MSLYLVDDVFSLGTGESKDTYVPKTLESFGPTVIKQVAAGKNHSLALSAEGVVYSWGRNDAGQLGFADTFIGISKNISLLLRLLCGH